MAPRSKNTKNTKEAPPAEDDPNIVKSSGEFTLPNGDRYTGEYCAHRYGLIWREGHGTYFTHDGQTYEGEWKDDKLADGKTLIIKYPTGEVFEGFIRNDKYFGPGTYTMDNSMFVSSNFTENQPEGNVVLVDINQRLWEGHAGPNNVLLLPENQFYASMSIRNGVGKLKHKRKPAAILSKKEDNLPPLELRESEIFKPSTKTINDVDFADSEWYRRYQKYRTIKDSVASKLLAEPKLSLSDEEKKWYKKYREHMRKKREAASQLLSKTDSTNFNHLKEYYNNELQNPCKPHKVFYPTVDWLYETKPPINGGRSSSISVTDVLY